MHGHKLPALSWQVTVIFFITFYPGFSWAEQEYFTWVDSQGRIHNSPLQVSSDEKNTEEDTDKGVVQSADGEEYLTEKALQEKLEEDKKNNPPFYTYVDEQGLVHSQEIVDARIEVEETKKVMVFDHILAPPFRVSEQLAKSCCKRYKNYFKDNIPEYESVIFSGFLNTVPISTRHGVMPAWYLKLSGIAEQRVLTVKLRSLWNHGNRKIDTQGQKSVASVILMDANYKPLYFIADLKTVFREGSWTGTDYMESLLKIEDKEVARMIIYFSPWVNKSASMEIEWWKALSAGEH